MITNCSHSQLALQGRGLPRVVGHDGEAVLPHSAQQAAHPVLLSALLHPELVLQQMETDLNLRETIK